MRRGFEAIFLGAIASLRFWQSFIYYQEGQSNKSVSPDVFVVFGVSNRKRRSYKVWQEAGKLPSFILEITSLSTKKQDEEAKPLLYASLGVPEYFQYDPTSDYLKPQLKGRRLVNGSYEPIPPPHLPMALSSYTVRRWGLIYGYYLLAKPLFSSLELQPES